MRWFSPAPIFDRSRTGTRVLACLVLRPVLILVLTLVLALAACSDDDPTSPPVEDPKIVEATIGSDGGILVSGDEVLTLEVPPFAFDAPTRVSIETIIGKDPAYRIGSANPSPALGVRVSWDLGVLSAPGDDRYRHRFTWLHPVRAARGYLGRAVLGEKAFDGRGPVPCHPLRNGGKRIQ